MGARTRCIVAQQYQFKDGQNRSLITSKMAAPLKDICRPFCRLLLRDQGVLTVVCKRTSLYDSKYIDTTKTYEALKEPLPKDDERRFRKIKAAPTDANTFVDYDPIVQKLINMLTKNGNKNLARDNVMKALVYVKHVQVEKYHKAPEAEKAHIELDPVKVLHQALENGKPLLMTKKVKQTGHNYLVPVAATALRQNFLSMKWLIEAGNQKQPKMRFYDKLGMEILNAYNFEGGLIRRKQEMHKLCEANRAVAHLS